MRARHVTLEARSNTPSSTETGVLRFDVYAKMPLNFKFSAYLDKEEISSVA